MILNFKIRLMSLSFSKIVHLWEITIYDRMIMNVSVELSMARYSFSVGLIAIGLIAILIGFELDDSYFFNKPVKKMEFYIC